MSTARAIADNIHATARDCEGPHHPLYCHQIRRLEYHNDGSLTCPHSVVEQGAHLQTALDYSVALLIVELAGDWQPSDQGPRIGTGSQSSQDKKSKQKRK